MLRAHAHSSANGDTACPKTFNNQGIESTFLRGRYLNQELIDKGFAMPV
jgi:hypothetical protein